MLHDSGADSGIKGDMITKINTPLFTGMAEANAKGFIYVDGVLSGELLLAMMVYGCTILPQRYRWLRNGR